ncbi:cysteine-rich receptor-like protein kinase 8 [Tanacetum coccineum]
MVSEATSNNTDTNPPPNDQITPDHPLFLLPTDHPGLLLISKKLISSDNYSSWRRSMVIALNAKNKMKIVNEDFVEPNTTSPIKVITIFIEVLFCMFMFDKKLRSMKFVKEVNPDGVALEATRLGLTV